MESTDLRFAAHRPVMMSVATCLSCRTTTTMHLPVLATADENAVLSPWNLSSTSLPRREGNLNSDHGFGRFQGRPGPPSQRVLFSQQRNDGIFEQLSYEVRTIRRQYTPLELPPRP